MDISYNSNLANLANPKVRRQKFGLGSMFILILIGGIFTTAGLFMIKSSKIDPSWARIGGAIVDSSTSISNGSTSYTPVVQYSVGGQSYKVTSRLGSSTYPRVGAPKQVAYDPAHPQNAKVVESATTSTLLYLIPAIGVALLALAPILFIRSMIRSSTIHHLMESGQKIQGVLTDVQTTGDSNNLSYKIVVTATSPSGSVRNYTSDSLQGIGGLALADFRNTPIPIDVYVDLADESNYYVEISDVPNLTPERIASILKSAAGRQPVSIAPSTPIVAGQPMPASPPVTQPAGQQATYPPQNPPIPPVQ